MRCQRMMNLGERKLWNRKHMRSPMTWMEANSLQNHCSMKEMVKPMKYLNKKTKRRTKCQRSQV